MQNIENYLQQIRNSMREEFDLSGPPILFLLRSTFVPKAVIRANRFKKKREKKTPSALNEEADVTID